MNGVHLDIAEWKQKKELERGAIAAAQQMALRQVIQNGETLGRYLLGRGRLASKLTSGNTALVLQEFPDSQAALTFQEWQTFGRNISKSAKGVSILTQQDGYLTVEKVFDLSQTYGNKPYPLVLLTAGEDYMQKALEALAPFCPVPIRKSKEITDSVLFASERQAILYRPDATEQQRFRYLPGAILQAYAEYYEPGVSQTDQVQFTPLPSALNFAAGSASHLRKDISSSWRSIFLCSRVRMSARFWKTSGNSPVPWGTVCRKPYQKRSPHNFLCRKLSYEVPPCGQNVTMNGFSGEFF